MTYVDMQKKQLQYQHNAKRKLDDLHPLEVLSRSVTLAHRLHLREDWPIC